MPAPGSGGGDRVPGLVRAYAGMVAEAVSLCLGRDLAGLWIGGSLALGDYAEGISDIDLVAVSETPLSPAACRDLPARIDDEVLPCPATGLDLLVFTRSQAIAPGKPARYELAVTTGRRWGLITEIAGADDEVLLDLEVVRRAGLRLAGRAGDPCIGPVPPERLRQALATALAWQREHLFDPDHDPRGEEAALAACRALHFVATGELISKAAAGRAAARVPGIGPAAGAALARRAGRIRTSMRGDEVRPLLAAAEGALAAR